MLVKGVSGAGSRYHMVTGITAVMGCCLMNPLAHFEVDTKWLPFADDIFKLIFLFENCYILIKISLKFVLRGLINNKPVLVQVTAWHLTTGKTLSEPMEALFSNAYMPRHSTSMLLARGCLLFGIINYLQYWIIINQWGTNTNRIAKKIRIYPFMKWQLEIMIERYPEVMNPKPLCLLFNLSHAYLYMCSVLWGFQWHDGMFWVQMYLTDVATGAGGLQLQALHKATYGKAIRLTICFNTLRPRQNGRHFADNIFKYIFLNEKFRIFIQIPLIFLPEGLINNKSA